MKSLPMYFPPMFDMEVARLCCRLCEIAYDQYGQWLKQHKPSKESGFSWKPPAKKTGLKFSYPIWSTQKWFHVINRSEPFGFVARADDGKGYLVFRGTETGTDWIDDLEVGQSPYDLAPGYGAVHHGFLKLYKEARDEILRAIEEVGSISQLWVSGHSLGCGFSTLAVPDLMTQYKFDRIEHYNFASPRIGDPAFTDQYNNNGILSIRVVNTCDIVPATPPSIFGKDLYKHIATVVNFTAQYGSLEDNHSPTKSYKYALDHPDDPEDSTGTVAQ